MANFEHMIISDIVSTLSLFLVYATALIYVVARRNPLREAYSPAAFGFSILLLATALRMLNVYFQYLFYVNQSLSGLPAFLMVTLPNLITPLRIIGTVLTVVSVFLGRSSAVATPNQSLERA